MVESSSGGDLDDKNDGELEKKRNVQVSSNHKKYQTNEMEGQFTPPIITNGASQTIHPKAEPQSILLKPRRVASTRSMNTENSPVTPKRTLTWNDDQGGGLVEVHYGEQLHYSIFSRDREIARRQQLRSGCVPDDLGVDYVDGRRCCLIS